jgi:hypothetical protein
VRDAARIVLLLGLAALLAVCAGFLSPRARENRQEGREVFYYPSETFLREAVLGYRQAAASVCWLRAVQYYGEHKRGDQQFEMMYHLCDLVTDLDPRFIEPYLFGSLVIFTEGDVPQEGMRLLAKGRDSNPDSWRLQFETGFALYLFAEDYRGAMPFFTKAASMEGAPERVKRFAAFVSERVGELETSLALWQEVAMSSTNPEIRTKAEMHIEELLGRIADRDRESTR